MSWTDNKAGNRADYVRTKQTNAALATHRKGRVEHPDELAEEQAAYRDRWTKKEKKL